MLGAQREGGEVLKKSEGEVGGVREGEVGLRDDDLARGRGGRGRRLFLLGELVSEPRPAALEYAARAGKDRLVDADDGVVEERGLGKGDETEMLG